VVFETHWHPISTGRSTADFEPGVSSLYRQVPSYTALYKDNSTMTRRPVPCGVPSYTALYPALRRKQPPIRFRVRIERGDRPLDSNSRRSGSTGGEVVNALVCKTSIHGFKSHPVLQRINYLASLYGLALLCVADFVAGFSHPVGPALGTHSCKTSRASDLVPARSRSSPCLSLAVVCSRHRR
jgi:hypothetical protein